MNDQLTLSFSPDNDGTGQLFARVYAGGFSGSGSAWFSDDEISRFCERLEMYPLAAEALPFLAGGYWGENGQLKEVLLSLSVKPFNATGRLLLSVTVARDDGSPTKLCRRAETWTVIGYNDATRLAQVLRLLIAGSAAELTLNFEVVG